MFYIPESLLVSSSLSPHAEQIYLETDKHYLVPLQKEHNSF